MSRHSLYGLLALGLSICFCSPEVRADEPAPSQTEALPKPKLEIWHAAYFEGVKAGYVHTTVHDLVVEGVKVVRTTRLLSLNFRRYNSVVPVRLEMASDEKADGKVVGLALTKFLDKDKKLITTGQIDGDKLLLRSSADPRVYKFPWNDEAIGQFQQERIYQQRKVKPGDSLHFVSYELALPAPLTIRATVKPEETVDMLVVRKQDGQNKIVRVPTKLLRVETLADKIDTGSGKLQLPGQVLWLNKEFLPVRYEWEFPGLGKVTLYQTTKEVALEEGLAPALLPDLGLNTLVRVKKTLEKPYETTEATYLITVKGDDDVASTFARDARQEVKNVKATSFELHVRTAAQDAKPEEAKDEFLESSYFLDSDNPLIKQRAARIVGTATDPLRKARLIERWVHDNMKPSNSIGFATAGQVCRDLEGDCRQHAMLTAALCRAAKIPARTAVGLIYVREPGRSPVFIFHMWTEVLIEGRWLGLDATLGRGTISACHLKVADHSWRNTQTLAPLLPVSRLLGKLSIEILSSK